MRKIDAYAFRSQLYTSIHESHGALARDTASRLFWRLNTYDAINAIRKFAKHHLIAFARSHG